MQGYDFIDQSSMRAAPGEAERPGGGRCEAHWWPWGRQRRPVGALRRALTGKRAVFLLFVQGIFNVRLGHAVSATGPFTDKNRVCQTSPVRWSTVRPIRQCGAPDQRHLPP